MRGIETLIPAHFLGVSWGPVIPGRSVHGGGKLKGNRMHCLVSDGAA